MNFFEFLKNKNKSLDDINKILDQETLSFFPESGHWVAKCFSNSSELSYAYLPCHLRDNKWLAKFMQQKLKYNNITNIPFVDILLYINTSDLFAKLRHEHELKIVEWQINYMTNDGEGWLLPEGASDCSLIFGTNQEVVFRDGVVKTLSAINLDREVIEEGLEKYSDLWREKHMLRSFANQFSPIIRKHDVKLPPVSPEFEKNWLRLKNYDYYISHKDSVDKYGTVTPDMKMTEEESMDLRLKVFKQSVVRNKEIYDLLNNSDNAMSSDYNF